jgi:ComF family protein
MQLMNERRLKKIQDLVFPPLCVFCSTPCLRKMCCDRCSALLPWNSIACDRCATPVSSALNSDGGCAACRQQQPAFTAAIAPLKYEFPVDMAIKSLKFRRNLYYTPVFSDMLLMAIRSHLIDADGLVPVPLHRWRQAFRGFNQAQELAKIISRRSGLPIVKNIVRVRATKTQSGLTADERKQNLRKAFKIAGQLPIRRPLIIDDVMTTGETCNQLARTLLSAGAEQVYVLVIARAQHADVTPVAPP